MEAICNNLLPFGDLICKLLEIEQVLIYKNIFNFYIIFFIQVDFSQGNIATNLLIKYLI